ncbi:MAG: mandelate racemase/muconate lactonizing enzyme family protein [Chloroflexota bacterium]
MSISHKPFQIVAAKARHESNPIQHVIKTAFGIMKARHAVFLLLENEAGQIGVGESWINFPVWGHRTRIAAFETAIIPWLEGRVVENVVETVGKLFQLLEGPARQSGTIGPMLSALCAVELALWDLAAQGEGKPLAHLLFDQPHDKVQVYASGINSPLPWSLIDAHLERGVTLFKLKLGFGEAEDRRNLVALKNHLSERAQLAVDVNRGWTIEQGKRWLPILAEHNVQWLEEPLRFADEHHYPDLHALSSVPLAGAENIQMEPLSDVTAVARSSFDILQPDVTKYTPLHVALKLQAAAEGLGKRMIPHILGSGPGQAASIQLAAGFGTGLVELDINVNRLRTDLCTEPFEIVDGSIALPNHAGIGWRLKEA